jgi:hypothetical protein
VVAVGAFLLLAFLLLRDAQFGGFDPDPEFVWVVENPCSTEIAVRVYAEEHSWRFHSESIAPQSTASSVWGLFEGYLVVEARDIGWAQRLPAVAKGETVTFRIDSAFCP